MPKSKLIFVDRDSNEWRYMWSAFAPNYSDPCPHTGEVRQYMGSVVTPAGEIWHEFRHRSDPQTGKRSYHRIPASAEFALSALGES